VLKGLWTQLYHPTLLSPVFDLTFDSDVQGKSAGWNILDQTPIDSKFHIIVCYTRVSILRDSGQIWPSKPFRRPRRHFVINEKIIYLRKTCWFGGM